VDYPDLTDLYYVRKIVDNLRTFQGHAELGMPIADRNILVFNNGLFYLKTKTLKEFDPK